jgi:hypothetical protein
MRTTSDPLASPSSFSSSEGRRSFGSHSHNYCTVNEQRQRDRYPYCGYRHTVSPIGEFVVPVAHRLLKMNQWWVSTLDHAARGADNNSVAYRLTIDGPRLGKFLHCGPLDPPGRNATFRFSALVARALGGI